MMAPCTRRTRETSTIETSTLETAYGTLPIRRALLFDTDAVSACPLRCVLARSRAKPCVYESIETVRHVTGRFLACERAVHPSKKKVAHHRELHLAPFSGFSHFGIFLSFFC